jgi:hypothetical protein
LDKDFEGLEEFEEFEAPEEIKVDEPFFEVEETMEEEEVVEVSEADPEVALVFDSAQVEKWVTRAVYRKNEALESVLIKDGAIPEDIFLWVFGLIVRSVVPEGTLYVPKNFPPELVDTFKKAKGKSAKGYLALIIP